MAGLPSTTGGDTASTYPNYLSTAHVQFLMGGTGVGPTTLAAVDPGSFPYNAIAFTQQAIDENPYASAEAKDPTEELAMSAEALEAFETLVATYFTAVPNTTGEKATVASFVAQAASLFATYNLDTDADIDAEVAAFELDSADTWARGRNSFEGAMFDVNAIETSPYIMGLSIIDSGHVRSVDDLRAKLLAAAKRDKNMFLLQLADLMTQLQTRNVGLQSAIASMRDNHSRYVYTSKREELMQNLEYDVGEIEWELESLKSGASIIGAISGIPMSPKKPSAYQTAISTALSTGPQVGMAIGNATHSPILGVAGGILASFLSYGANING